MNADKYKRFKKELVRISLRLEDLDEEIDTLETKKQKLAYDLDDLPSKKASYYRSFLQVSSFLFIILFFIPSSIFSIQKQKQKDRRGRIQNNHIVSLG